MNLEVQLAGIKLKNPVMTASGTFGYGEEYAEFMDLSRLGAVVVKGLSLQPRDGNPPPRVVETAAGMLNAIGLQNVGIETFIREKMPFLRRFDTAVIVNFFGDSVGEYAAAAERLSSVEGINGLEMNISCPNKQAGWCIFGTDPRVTFEVVGAVRKATTLPLIVKLSPNVTDITVMARAAEDAGADALSLINTLTGMAIDIRTRRPVLGNVTGGLSGPAIKPVAVRMVYEVSRAVGIPVVGMGGIMSGDDAVEFLIAGASAVAVGTANFVRPTAATEILDGIIAYMEREKIEHIGSLTGSVDSNAG
jgi:dihydroorotate dehydrogenase (NAD+) catalytic subunit